MRVFVDTSALYALMDRIDANHPAANAAWTTFMEHEEELVTSNYVVVEAVALVQNRLGNEAVRVLLDDVLSVIELLFVEPGIHRAAAASMIAARRRKLSLVDCVSLELMRRDGIEMAFSFDRHFQQFGFFLYQPK